ncbi:hypothetical protein ACS0TY_003658 [Phlomoides rotata]
MSLDIFMLFAVRLRIEIVIGLLKRSVKKIASYFIISESELIHECVGKLVTNDTERLCSRIISNVVLQNVRENPMICPKEPNFETYHFERVFIAFKTCIDGFRKCRAMLFIDDTLMTGRAKGILLSATTKYGNNG